jgi:hypothetical protein
MAKRRRQYRPSSASVIDHVLGHPQGRPRVSDSELRRIVTSDPTVSSHTPPNSKGGRGRAPKSPRYPARHERIRIDASQRHRCPVAA